MSKTDRIPSVELIEPRANPMIWENEEAAQGVFLGLDPAEDPLAVLGTPALELPARPRLPEDFQATPALENWLQALREGIASTVTRPDQTVELSLELLDDLSVLAITEILGEGDVDCAVTLDDIHYRVQESVLTGVWRVRGDDGSDRVEIGAAPGVILRAAASLQQADFTIPMPGDSTMNAPAVLAEIRERAANWEGEANHVLNFTLLPMTGADHRLLTATLGRADLSISSGGFGNCRIFATRYRHVWAVQYVNAMGHTILDTIEVGGLPAAASAAWQDLEDSGTRLGELLETYLT